MMQGDEYGIPFQLKKDSDVVTDADVTDVEIMIGTLKKTFADEEVEYHNEAFWFPLTQTETFAFDAKEQPVQIRTKFTDGQVIGIDCGYIDVVKSRSQVQL